MFGRVAEQCQLKRNRLWDEAGSTRFLQVVATPFSRTRQRICRTRRHTSDNVPCHACGILPRNGGRLQRNVCKCEELLRSLSPSMRPQTDKCPHNRDPKKCNEPSFERRLLLSTRLHSVRIQQRTRCTLECTLGIFHAYTSFPFPVVVLTTTPSDKNILRLHQSGGVWRVHW